MTASRLLLVLAALPAVLANPVVQPAPPGAFSRAAVESRPELAASGSRRLPLRDSVEYRPNLDHAPAPVRLRIFTGPIFLSQFDPPALHVDYFRQTYPFYAPIAPLPFFFNVLSKSTHYIIA